MNADRDKPEGEADGEGEGIRAPSPERALIDKIEAGMTEGDDRLLEYRDGRPYEVLSDGRRVPLDD